MHTVTYSKAQMQLDTSRKINCSLFASNMCALIVWIKSDLMQKHLMLGIIKCSQLKVKLHLKVTHEKIGDNIWYQNVARAYYTEYINTILETLYCSQMASLHSAIDLSSISYFKRLTREHKIHMYYFFIVFWLPFLYIYIYIYIYH